MQHFFIIDAIGFLFRSFYAIRGMSSSKGVPTNALYGFIRSIEKLFKDFDPKYCVAVFDGPNNKASRVKLYEHYKSNRTGMPDDLAVQLDPALEFCKLAGIPVLQIDGVEADDTIGTLTRFGLEHGFFINIVSQDKDLCQLVSPKVNLIHAHKDNLIVNSEKVHELYGVNPDQIVDYLAIIGDVAYILFLLYNGIDDGFRDILSVQSIAPIGMIFLLILNILLICQLKRMSK